MLVSSTLYLREGEAGRKKINQYARYATVGLCVIQALVVARWIERFHEGNPDFEFVPEALRDGLSFELTAMIALTAGTIFLMWLGEQITEHGIGNGISLIIMAGIVARMPIQIFQVMKNDFDWSSPFSPAESKIGVAMVIVLVALYVGVVLAIVVIQQGQRRVTVQHAKLTRGHRVYGGQRHYMPLRVNAAGVIPIIFAQSLLNLPMLVVAALAARWAFMGWFQNALNPGNFGYILTYSALIFFFCYFWTAVQFNPVKMADDMKERGAFVPGIRPGRRTAEYLEKLMTRVTFAGAIFLCLIAVLPQLVQGGFNLSQSAAYLYGGTGLLIVVGVALDVVQKIESHLMMRHYDGFMKRGRVKGRT